jgi:outer membrane protein TolC
MTRFRTPPHLAILLAVVSCGLTARAQEAAPASGEARLVDDEPDHSLGDAFLELLVPHGLTADAAAELAKARAPAMQKAEAGVEIASARAREARTAFFGRTEVGYRYTRIKRITNPTIFQSPGDGDIADLNALVENVTDPSAQALLGSYVQLLDGLSNATFPILRNRQALFASFTYPVSDVFFRVLPGYRAADRAKEASELELVAASAGVERNARIAYYEYARALSADIVARQSLVQMEAARNQIRALVDGGVLPPVDLMRLNAQLASVEVGVARADLGVRVTEQFLRALLGLGSDEAIALATSVLDEPSEVDFSEDEALEMALNQRPEIQALQVATEAQRHAARAAAGGRYPQIFAQGNAEYSNPNPLIIPQEQRFRSSWDVSAIIRWSPDETVIAQRRRDAALAELRRIEADETALRDALRVEIAQSHRAFAAAQIALEAARVGLEAAEESYRVRMMQLEAGAAVTRDLIDAESDLTRARLEMVDAVIGIRQARVALDYATGKYASSR